MKKIFIFLFAMLLIGSVSASNNSSNQDISTNYISEICSNNIDDDGDGLIDYKDTNDCKKPDGSCVVENWVWSTEKNEYVPETWIHPKLKEIEKEYGKESKEYEKWKNYWNEVEGCAVVKNGKKVPKPTDKPIKNNVESKYQEDNKESNIVEKQQSKEIEDKPKKGFFSRMFSWIFD